MKHLDELRVFAKHQLGFREGRSCVTKLLKFYSREDVLQETDGLVGELYLFGREESLRSPKQLVDIGQHERAER